MDWTNNDRLDLQVGKLLHRGQPSAITQPIHDNKCWNQPVKAVLASVDLGSVLHSSASLGAGVFDVPRTTARGWSGPRGAALPVLDAHASARSLCKAAEKLQHGADHQKRFSLSCPWAREQRTLCWRTELSAHRKCQDLWGSTSYLKAPAGATETFS